VINATFLRSVALKERVSFRGNGGEHKNSGSSLIYSSTRSLTYTYVVPKPTFKTLERAMSADHIKNAVALAHQLAF
jgi:hypothetical protein